jgi:hypothetical protein
MFKWLFSKCVLTIQHTLCLVLLGSLSLPLSILLLFFVPSCCCCAAVLPLAAYFTYHLKREFSLSAAPLLDVHLHNIE